MKVCVVGAGAIGGFMAVRLALSGHEVSVIARGPHLAAIREHGLRLRQDGEEHVARDIVATDRLDEIGPQDMVLLAVKAHQIEPVVDDLTKLLAPDGVIVTLQNGIPWWYFQKLGGEHDGRTVRAVDPNGTLARTIDPDRIVGCIAFPAATIAEPGVIQHVEGVRFPVGELDGDESDRVKSVSEAFTEAGFKAYILPDIRSEIWLKLWGNLTFNPISALTHATLEDLCRFPLTRQLATAMMTEAQTIGETSMLQDVEVGKALEIDGMLGAVIELGELTNTPTPALSAVYALVSLLNKTIQDEQIRIKGQLLETGAGPAPGKQKTA